MCTSCWCILDLADSYAPASLVFSVNSCTCLHTNITNFDHGYEKIAIVASEGGMSCAYFFGVISALVEKFNLINPYLVIGSSGSTGTFAYYVAGQYESIRNIWENLLPSKKFISLLRLHKMMDIDYLVDDIFKKQDVLDVEKVKLSKIKLFISATNIETGALEYFGNQTDVDIFEALRASSAALSLIISL